jgi:proprotein convertase subtilisin/kexin type 2
MQHLTVLTAKRNQLYDPTNKHLWHINGAGLEFNHLFGFGVLDAGEMVRTAQNWKPLPPRSHCEAGSIKKKQYGDKSLGKINNLNFFYLSKAQFHELVI